MVAVGPPTARGYGMRARDIGRRRKHSHSAGSAASPGGNGIQNPRKVQARFVRITSGRQARSIQRPTGHDMGTSNLSKTERIDVRASTPVKQLLQEAARACHKNVSEFLLDAGVTAASQTLADRRQFVLDEARWRTFQAALDRPVQNKPRLKKLLRKPGVLD